MKPGGRMMGELMKLENYPVRSARDAQAICRALQTLALEGDSERQPISRVYALATLFQEVESEESPAYPILAEEGLRWLIRIFRTKLKGGSDDDITDLLFILKVLSFYFSREAAEAVVEAARLPLNPQNCFWTTILGVYAFHPQRSFVFDSLCEPLPPLSIGMGLLECANVAAVARDLDNHPFDSAAGCDRLEEWLLRPLPNHEHCSMSAVTALEFLKHSGRDTVLTLALAHGDPKIQLEAARIAASLGQADGLRLLARFATDLTHADLARDYLSRLEREDLIPQDVADPAFERKALLAQLLSQPDQLGAPPDEMEVIDQRELAWPPFENPVNACLIRYRLYDRTGLEADQVGCGCVAGHTNAYHDYRIHERPPEDAYAIYCAGGLQIYGLIEESDDIEDEEQYLGLLRHWQGPALEYPVITHVAELSGELSLGTRLVVLASGSIAGEDGWLVLDGKHTAWYPQAEQPRDTPPEAILRLHIGRRLLGFTEQPDRRKFLQPVAALDPKKVVAAYEGLLSELETSTPSKQKKLLRSDGLLTRHAEAYVDALAATRGIERAEAAVEVYGRWLQVAHRLEPSVKSEAFDSLGPPGVLFDRQVDSLLALGRPDDVVSLINLLVPHWQNNLGYTRFSSAALKVNQPDLALSFLMKIRDSAEKYELFYSFTEELSTLAEIWAQRGEGQQARELLIRCMRALIAELSDRRYREYHKKYASNYRQHRAKYLELFPEGEQELNELNLLSDP